MDIVRGAARVVTETANATTAAAGAVSGAAINGIIGGVQGTAKGIRDGVGSGSHSTPAALLTLGAVGATGLVEWPLLLTVGGAALLIHQFSGRGRGGGNEQAEGDSSTARSTPSTTTRRAAPASSNRRSAPAKSTKKAAKSAPRKRTRSR